jgi:hypothetical protein
VTPKDYEKLEEISRLLEEAYDHYFKYESHCKSSEGHIDISYGNLWDRREEGLKIKYVHIYSYVFCKEGRSQDFDSLDDALETVREWHKEEMAYDYEAPEEVAAREEFDKFAVSWLNQMQEDGRLHIHMIDGDDNELR